MQLNNLILDTSPKTSWQCFDLGCRVALAEYKTLFGYWLVLTVPIFSLLILINEHWGLLVFWLFKPWYERGLLYILSRSVFGTQVSIKQVLLALPSQIKPLWFSSITYRRLAFSRSFDMAVTQLENLSGERRSKRLRVLHKSKDDNTAWWTICCVHWESFMALALITLIQILIPSEFDFWSFFNPSSTIDPYQNHIFAICVFVSIALVAPFYIAGGFVAYLNRRVILEGWDIELGFTKWRKSYVEKTAKTRFLRQSQFTKPSKTAPVDKETVDGEKIDNSSTKNQLAIAILLLINIGFLAPDNAFAQSSTLPVKNESVQTSIEKTSDTSVELNANEEHDPLASKENDPFKSAKQKISSDLEKVLDEAPFAQRETVTNYRWKMSTEEIDESTSDYSFLLLVATFMASSFEIILWVLFISVFVYLIYRNWGHVSAFFASKSAVIEDAPLPSFISTAFAEELPDDILLSVQQAVDSEDYRRALSILVRASFTYLSKEQHINITKSMTENECLLEIKQTCPDQVYLFMQSLLYQWMKMAWAHQMPNAEALLVLLQEYSHNFIQGSVIHESEQDSHPSGLK